MPGAGTQTSALLVCLTVGDKWHHRRVERLEVRRPTFTPQPCNLAERPRPAPPAPLFPPQESGVPEYWENLRDPICPCEPG